jgi:hypothetical protein
MASEVRGARLVKIDTDGAEYKMVNLAKLADLS